MKAPGLLGAGCSASTVGKSMQKLYEGHCEHFVQVDNFSPGMNVIMNRRSMRYLKKRNPFYFLS